MDAQVSVECYHWQMKQDTRIAHVQMLKLTTAIMKAMGAEWPTNTYTSVIRGTCGLTEALPRPDPRGAIMNYHLPAPVIVRLILKDIH